MSRLPAENAACNRDIVGRDLKQVLINVRRRSAFRRRDYGALMSIAADRIGPPLDRELGAKYAALGRKLLDNDVSTAGQLPGVEWCGTDHAAGATGAFIETVRDVADLPGPLL